MKDTLEDAAERLDRGVGDVDDAERLGRKSKHAPSQSKGKGRYGDRLKFIDLGEEDGTE